MIESAGRPFEGIRVVDLTQVLAGPYCSYQFALLGADVIKVENTCEPDVTRGRGVAAQLNEQGLGLTFQVQGANKRAIVIDLTKPDGTGVFLDLIETADVLVVNLRPGAMHRLGLGADVLCSLNPRLIHCTISGFGEGDARADRGAYDNVIQAASGMMAQTGKGGEPIKTGASVIDYLTGMTAAFAISAALVQRAASGKGQRIDCAMHDAALATMAPEIAGVGWRGSRQELPHEAGLGCYATASGLVMLGAYKLSQNRRLWEHLGDADFAAIRDWPTLWAAADAMKTALTAIFLAKAAEDWEQELNEIGIPAQSVKTLEQACTQAASQPHPMFRDVDGATLPLAPFRFSRGGPMITSAPPKAGQHTRAILRELGRDEASIDRLMRHGAVA